MLNNILDNFSQNFPAKWPEITEKFKTHFSPLMASHSTESLFIDSPAIMNQFRAKYNLFHSTNCGLYNPSIECFPIPFTQNNQIASDVTVAELRELVDLGEYKHVMVLFHASWCGPCKKMKTPYYQKTISDYNAAHPDELVVTLGIDNPIDAQAEAFWKEVAGGDEYLPKALYLNTQDDTFCSGPVVVRTGVADINILMKNYADYENRATTIHYPFPHE